MGANDLYKMEICDNLEMEIFVIKYKLTAIQV